ncbi:hypothetical protein [Sandaracinus amylolyticus]|uniref:Uncharacterized protein n=1 Tax=Sandaracinus amylolyticus TaxID=927083 RepID=A0A0F6SGC1_9BACT|nr:hypothetical protein [Sandaracinus amylolyticus]AKF08434.1 hypothetical protein DB32_005583 [Sandaracinus amylolyticus]
MGQGGGESGTVVVVDGASSVVVDTRAWPVVIATWFGEPTEALVERYFAVHGEVVDRARASRTRFVLITDTFATGAPSPKARKRIVDLTAAQAPDVAALTVRSFVVIESMLMRGVVTALAWVYPKMAESENVATITIALERAFAELDAARVARPVGMTPRDYRRPARP